MCEEEESGGGYLGPKPVCESQKKKEGRKFILFKMLVMTLSDAESRAPQHKNPHLLLLDVVAYAIRIKDIITSKI